VDLDSHGDPRKADPRTRPRELLHGCAGRQGMPREGRNGSRGDRCHHCGNGNAGYAFPATACLVQREIGARRAWGFDLSAGCSAFVFALTTGAQMIEAGRCDKVLVIGSDVMSTIVDYEDRNTCVLFGDAAGAALLEPCPEAGYGLLDFCAIYGRIGGGIPSHEGWGKQKARQLRNGQKQGTLCLSGRKAGFQIRRHRDGRRLCRKYSRETT